MAAKFVVSESAVRKHAKAHGWLQLAREATERVDLSELQEALRAVFERVLVFTEEFVAPKKRAEFERRARRGRWLCPNLCPSDPT